MKVLIVDADPQSDVSAGFGYRWIIEEKQGKDKPERGADRGVR